jgi:RND family efflux transporter MFP subunit
MSLRSRFLLSVVVAGLVGCHGLSDEKKKAESKEEGEGAEKEAHVTVRVEPARRGSVVETVEGLGRSDAIPWRLATLTPAVEGHVHELVAKQGQAVKKDQPIVELDKEVALADFAEKTATRDSLKAGLVLLKSLPRKEERRANELAVDQAKVAVERARAVFDRLKPLRTSNLASEQQLFDAEKALLAATLQQRTAEAQLRAMMIGPRPEAVAEAEAKIKVAEGLVAFSKAHLDFHTIRSPIDGVLDSLTCHPGQTIAIGAPIGEVIDTREVFVSVYLPARSVQEVRVGQTAGIQVEESHRESSTAPAKPDAAMAGKVDFIGRIADLQTGNLPVRILLDNPEGRLKVGETVRVKITVEEHKDVLQVPAVAIFDQGEGPVVNVVREGKSVAIHPELGTVKDGWTAVSGTDLKEGEPVIVEGGYNLPEGTPVKVEQAVARVEHEQ